MTRRGVTLAEVLVAVGIGSCVLVVAYGMMQVLFGGGNRHSVTSMTRRSFVQKDARSGLRRLIYRLREGIQVLEPEPGRGGAELIFRDITNQRIRIRRDGSRMVSERWSEGGWVEELRPTMFASGSTQLPASWPVLMPSCTDLWFSVLAPDCVAVEASLVVEGQAGSLATVIKLRNAGIAN